MPPVRLRSPASNSRPRTQPPKVALLIETSNAYARGLLVGVEDYLLNHGLWNVYLGEQGRGDTPPGWLAHCPMARRSLEQRVKTLLGRTPHEEILRVQLNRAKELLAATELTLPEIASRSGFRHAE